MTQQEPPRPPSRPLWEGTRPRLYSVVTGFFPETSPKDTWATNPRPLLVCGTAEDPETRTYFCRVAYGTSAHLDKGHPNDLVVGNLSMLNGLNLKKPTRFVTHSGRHMVIMPWTYEFFRPWNGLTSPVLSYLPDEMQRFVGHVLAELNDLPQF